MTHGKIVPPRVPLLTVEDTREMLAPSLLRLCSEHGPKRVAASVGGCDEKTIRDARDEKSTLRFDYAANLLALDGTAFDPILEHFGRVSVPKAVESAQSDRACESKVLTAALALSVALADDDQIDAEEVRRNRVTIENAIESLQGLLGKLVKAA